MGSGRKRPAGRSQSPTGGGGERKSKKKKTKLKHNKETTSAASESTSHKPSLETTATAEGQIMAQVLSTFSRLEQSRFEAFRRSTFAGDAISKYVAQLLIQRKHPEDVGRREPVLSELCAPNQAEEITIVVSTLAKAYAQRLLTAARQRMVIENNNQQTQQQQQQQQQKPIEAHHILNAHRERQAQGLDPGFFLQPAPSTTNLCVDQNSTKSYEQLRLAALEAQENYDKEHGPYTERGGDDDDDNNRNNDNDVVMEDASPRTPNQAELKTAQEK